MSAHSGWDVSEKVDELLASPAGCAFLLVLEESKVDAADAALPEMSLQSASFALQELNIWAPDFQEIMEYALLNGRRLKNLARTVLEQPGVEWWFEPIARESQMWISDSNEPPTAANFESPNLRMTNWERRTNKAETALYTCTSLGGVTSFSTVMDMSEVHGPVNDMATYFEFPLRQWRIRVSEDARVYEINGAEDWHRLCTKYPARSARDASDPDASDVEGWDVYPLRQFGGSSGVDVVTDMGRWLTPNWAAVAADWDGVHLTLGGLLAAEKVRVASTAGWTMHRFWNIEQTMWLRWAFDDVERLPDRDEMPLPIEMSFPFADYWKFRDAKGKDYGQAIKSYAARSS